MNFLRRLLLTSVARCHPNRMKLIYPTKEQCGNCHAYLKPGDKYCRVCGTKAGEWEYEPYLDMMQCVYGPPPEERGHICQQCGYKWTTYRMIDRQKYCPKCGGIAPYDKELAAFDGFDRESGGFGKGEDTIQSTITLTDIHTEGKAFIKPIKKSLIIGFSQDSDICINYDKSVSRTHCEIVREGDNHYLINHSQSNGTLLNGIRVVEKTPIFDGAVIKMGRVEMRVNIQ